MEIKIAKKYTDIFAQGDASEVRTQAAQARYVTVDITQRTIYRLCMVTSTLGFCCVFYAIWAQIVSILDRFVAFGFLRYRFRFMRRNYNQRHRKNLRPQNRLKRTQLAPKLHKRPNKI